MKAAWDKKKAAEEAERQLLLKVGAASRQLPTWVVQQWKGMGKGSGRDAA